MKNRALLASITAMSMMCSVSPAYLPSSKDICQTQISANKPNKKMKIGRFNRKGK
ncbi:MAG: hypothetical protein Q4F95_07415 [Oscillospiraceae bacterium]|nr:hypothetical protein [Oscillospiraceae bacterium]